MSTIPSIVDIPDRRNWLNGQHEELCKIHFIFQQFYYLHQEHCLPLPSDFSMGIVYAMKFDPRFEVLMRSLIDAFPSQIISRRISCLVICNTIDDTFSESLPPNDNPQDDSFDILNVARIYDDSNDLEEDTKISSSDNTMVAPKEDSCYIDEEPVSTCLVDSDLSDTPAVEHESPWLRVMMIQNASKNNALSQSFEMITSQSFQLTTMDYSLLRADGLREILNGNIPTNKRTRDETFSFVLPPTKKVRFEMDVKTVTDEPVTKLPMYAGKCYDSIKLLDDKMNFIHGPQMIYKVLQTTITRRNFHRMVALSKGPRLSYSRRDKTFYIA